MANKIITVFIRDTSINLLEMRDMRVQKWASLPLEPGLVTQGVVVNEDQVAARVRELFNLEKISSKKVIAGLSGLNSLYRLITLPELPEALLDEAVRREAERVMPVSLDEVYLSYQPVPSPKGEIQVFLAVFPREGADALLRTLRKAGLEPYLMDLAPLALCRIPNEPRAIIVNARSEHLTIMVMAERLPQLIRWLQLPGEAGSLSEKLPAITEELSRTVTFYNSSHLEKPLDSSVPVFVCGEIASEPESWQSLVGRLNYPVSALTSPVEHLEGFPQDEFMVNIGLALKELLVEDEEANFSIVNLNTLPEVYQPRAFPFSKVLVPAGIIVGVGVLGFMGFLFYDSTADTKDLRSQLQREQASVTQQLEEVAGLKQQVEQMEPQLEPIQTQIAGLGATTAIFETTMADLAAGRAKVNGDLVQIVDVLPATVDITRINHGANSVSIDGAAQDEDDIFKYAKSLRAGGRGYAVIISALQEETSTEEAGGEYGYYRFNIQLK